MTCWSFATHAVYSLLRIGSAFLVSSSPSLIFVVNHFDRWLYRGTEKFIELSASKGGEHLSTPQRKISAGQLFTDRQKP